MGLHNSDPIILPALCNSGTNMLCGVELASNSSQFGVLDGKIGALQVAVWGTVWGARTKSVKFNGLQHSLCKRGWIGESAPRFLTKS